MRNIILVSIFSMVLAGCIGPGKNSKITINQQNTFPEITGIDLHGNERVLPDAFEKKYNIVAIGFEREHQESINTWIDVAENIMEERNDVGFYEVPVIYELNALWRAWVNNGMRSGIPDQESRSRTITIYTDRDKFLTFFNMDVNNNYVLLLNHKGQVLWRDEGAVTDGKSSREILIKAIEMADQDAA